MIFGKNLKEIRSKWKMGQDELGKYFGLKRGGLYSYESGITEPKIQFLTQLHEMTRIPIYDLAKREIHPDEIPDKPYEQTAVFNAVVPEKREFPLDNNIEEPLYNHHLMVKKIKELEERVKGLEGK